MINRSHITQRMQNYFDFTDVRSRENPVALEAQLLNLAGFELEDLTLRINRELSQTLQTVPTNVDNGGVYYSSPVPNALQPTEGITVFTNVIGLIDNTEIPLTPYIDTLPTPSRLTLDVDNSVAFSDPLMFTIIGNAYSTNGPAKNYTVQYAHPGAFPIPNKLTVWIDEIGFNLVNVTLTITGEVFPMSPWVSEQKITTEILNVTQEGGATSLNRWSNISNVTVRNLAPGMRLRGYSMPFNLYAVRDIARPYIKAADRGIEFPRYWKIDNNSLLLKEMYQVGLFTGMETVNSYTYPIAVPVGTNGLQLEPGNGDILLEDQSDFLTQEKVTINTTDFTTMTDVAVEPNSNGIFLSAANTIFYLDRREYQASLAGTGLTTEPLYGLQVYYDITKTGPTRFVILSATPYANSNNISQYRYVVNGTNSILPNGALGPINAGWRSGSPAIVTFPIVNIGDYIFQLQMQDINGNTTIDTIPFKAAILTPLVNIDMSSVDIIKGMAYDSYGKLWIWNGSYAVPIDIHYDGYIYDPINTTIYVTEPFDSLQITV